MSLCRNLVNPAVDEFEHEREQKLFSIQMAKHKIQIAFRVESTDQHVAKDDRNIIKWIQCEFHVFMSSSMRSLLFFLKVINRHTRTRPFLANAFVFQIRLQLLSPRHYCVVPYEYVFTCIHITTHTPLQCRIVNVVLWINCIRFVRSISIK